MCEPWWVIWLTVDWRTISLLADLVWDLFVWAESESVDKMSLAQSRHPWHTLEMISILESLNTSPSYHNSSQPAETAPSTSEMLFHPLNLSEQGLAQEWNERLYLRFDSEPDSSDYNAATGRLSHARTNFLQWHFNRQFLFATQICSKASW